MCLKYTQGKQEIDLSGRRVLCRTENFADDHARWSTLLETGKLPHYLKQLSGEDMLLFKEKINYKFAGAGGYAPHLDAQAYIHIKEVQHLTVMLAIDSCGPENGCLEIVDGSHRMNVPIGENNCLTPEWIESNTWMPIPLEAGEILIFTSYVAHRSQTNMSNKSRRALYATYNVASDGDLRKKYYAERAREWPATHKMQKGNKYAAGVSIHAMGTPMMSILQGKALSVDDSCSVDHVTFA